jgi:putative transposase
MGSVSDAYDNAMAESFFATLECELLARKKFRNPGEAKLALFGFVEDCTTRVVTTRRRATCRPCEFERRHPQRPRTPGPGFLPGP